MQKIAAEIVFTVRKGRNPYQGLPSSVDGKRRRGRGNGGGTPVHRITFHPHPHVTVRIDGTSFEALIDTRSEASFINADTAEQLSTLGYVPDAGAGQIHLADGTGAVTRGTVILPVQIWGKYFRYKFQVLDTLERA
ncbi:hypothetical protein DMN91_011784 [Ooceraea biroi]|uniref:Peptidase A2 domain-containing protein n=1 Tax=Ooceraea biroi TaxID=2015173 RepID=A0A3L8D712_OOCBI|nr:hypothetical protein DMN91_011784 [Ooceraea biroi]